MEPQHPIPNYVPKTVHLTAEQQRLYQRIRSSEIGFPPDLIDWLNGHPHADLDDLWEDIVRWVASTR